MEIHFLGTGSAYPGRDRDNTSICISTNDYHVLMDVSGNPCRKLKQINVALEDLDSVIFTHFHIDHLYGLPSLLWGMWLENRKKPLTIYCHDVNISKLNQWLNTMEVYEWGITFPLLIKTFDGGFPEELLKTRDVRISAFPAIHSVPTIGLEVTEGNKTIVYSSDSQVNSHIQTYPHIHLLIHEATSAIKVEANHTSLTEIAESYDLEKIDKVVLVHLSDHQPYDEELSRLKLEYKVQKAEEMMSISI
ncbi:MBL fold metallo-hydrolase [Fictibacillus phosphorivorans]|uniref:MBL fold metallo-hydrolase n=1 Tax=Fictibacillus phosphorivorans TaxID=1221500 RepID=UPI00203AE8C1|nr:ribonuclease Z [Fictibacillus phosphorivorans]MCM3720090.1 ribonuclease Z [Fictibacillus phosphorivorans]MCM3777780.1 ribonuclease Z [Fictibacillus phosphorivorans]